MKKQTAAVLAIIFISLSFVSSTSHANCWDYSSRKFGIEVQLLKAIAQVESGMKPSASAKNKNGTVDIGIMQINSIHFQRLKKIGINSHQLQHDPCLNVIVGTSILADMMSVYGYSWEAVGAFNAGTSKDRHILRMKYAKKVWTIYSKNKP